MPPSPFVARPAPGWSCGPDCPSASASYVAWMTNDVVALARRTRAPARTDEPSHPCRPSGWSRCCRRSARPMRGPGAQTSGTSPQPVVRPLEPVAQTVDHADADADRLVEELGVGDRRVGRVGLALGLPRPSARCRRARREERPARSSGTGRTPRRPRRRAASPPTRRPAGIELVRARVGALSAASSSTRGSLCSARSCSTAASPRPDARGHRGVHVHLLRYGVPDKLGDQDVGELAAIVAGRRAADLSNQPRTSRWSAVRTSTTSPSGRSRSSAAPSPGRRKPRRYPDRGAGNTTARGGSGHHRRPSHAACRRPPLDHALRRVLATQRGAHAKPAALPCLTRLLGVTCLPARQRMQTQRRTMSLGPRSRPARPCSRSATHPIEAR